MKVVLDTNVLVSGFIATAGVSSFVLSSALKRHTVILSEFILEELERTLLRKIKIPAGEVENLSQFLRTRCEILRVLPNPKIHFSDKQDIPILSLVEAIRPHYLISGDKEILELKKFGQTLILSPREALEFL